MSAVPDGQQGGVLEPKRILLLTQFYPPVIGGVEVHVEALARGLSERGHDVSVATLAADGSPPFERTGGVGVHRLQGAVQRLGFLFSTDRRHATPVPDPELVLALRRLVAELRPDIVHAHNWLGRSFVPLKRWSGARYVVSLHDCSRACSQGRRMLRNERFCEGPGDRCGECCAAYFGRAKGAITLHGNRAMRGPETRAVDLFLPVSTAVANANELPESGVRYEVVPNFYDDTAHPENGSRPMGIPDEPFLLQVGDAVPDKGIDVLLEAYNRIESPLPLVIIGRITDERAAVLPRGVTALGPLPHEAVVAAWRRCAFGTIPSLCLDASPTVTLEAMASSKPVIASARGGLTDQVVDGETGLLVEPGDVASLAAAISRMSADPGLRARMGSAARRRYEREFSAKVVIDRIEHLYSTLSARD